MKTNPLLLASFVLLTSISFAGKMFFPNEEDAICTITIPDTWKAGKAADGTVEAMAPDLKAYLATWAIESEKDLAALSDDIVELLKDHANEIKARGEPEKTKVGGTMNGYLISGTAKDKIEGNEIKFYALVFAANADHLAVVFIEAQSETTKDQTDKLTGILKSIKPGKG